MAWGWWKRRRRRWWRGVFRRRRLARRRPRWTARRPRRRRVRRRRRWRRGRRRRRQYRRKRRFRRRRKKPKIVIKQWQPDMVRRCYIIGYMAALISGNGTFAINYSSHLEDRIMKGPFGGGHSTLRYSLYVLYQEHLRHGNFWTYSNKDLELTRYLGATLTFYRSPDTDFIVTYSRKSPLGGNIYTAPSLHPGNAMLAKHKILIPSLETRPKGKKTVKIRLAPPTLFVDKWYFQKDICDLSLFNLNVTMADLRFPFCSPQTDNTCVSFQVLKSCYNNYLSINKFNNDSGNTQLTAFFKLAFPDSGTTARSINQLNTFKTEGNISHPKLQKASGSDNNPGSNEYFAKKDALWGDPIYLNTSTQTKDKIISDFLIKNMESYHKKITDEQFPHSWQGNKAFCHLTGIYSSPFLNSGRISPEVFGLYTEIIYNPYTDKGKGNRVWIDPLTKEDNIYSATQSKCLLEDAPLWCLLFGYTDWIKKDLNHWDAPLNYRILLVSPYTYPKMYHENNPNYGYVPFSYKFGAGQMPDGSAYIPFIYRAKWYPNILHQQQVMEDVARAGPFAPKTQKPSSQLVMKYKFRFNWGGNPISEQIVRDPCTQPTFEIPGGGNLPRRIQVVDPKILGPSYSFRSWDIRRGMFSTASLKRVSAEPETSEFLFSGPKRPRIDLPKYQPPEDASCTLQRESRPWSTEEEETESEAPSEEEETTSVREQLQQQYREQLKLRQGIKHLFQQLVRTQQGVHVNPSLL
nr:MAG: ORF1 [Torque teno virus]